MVSCAVGAQDGCVGHSLQISMGTRRWIPPHRTACTIVDSSLVCDFSTFMEILESDLKMLSVVLYWAVCKHLGPHILFTSAKGLHGRVLTLSCSQSLLTPAAACRGESSPLCSRWHQRLRRLAAVSPFSSFSEPLCSFWIPPTSALFCLSSAL